MSGFHTTAAVMALGALAFLAWDASRAKTRSAQRVRRLKQALFNIYHMPNAPENVRQHAMKAIKEGGDQ